MVRWIKNDMKTTDMYIDDEKDRGDLLLGWPTRDSCEKKRRRKEDTLK